VSIYAQASLHCGPPIFASQHWWYDSFVPLSSAIGQDEFSLTFCLGWTRTAILTHFTSCGGITSVLQEGFWMYSKRRWKYITITVETNCRNWVKTLCNFSSSSKLVFQKKDPQSPIRDKNIHKNHGLMHTLLLEDDWRSKRYGDDENALFNSSNLLSCNDWLSYPTLPAGHLLLVRVQVWPVTVRNRIPPMDNLGKGSYTNFV
jgi:hypothetical protein